MEEITHETYFNVISEFCTDMIFAVDRQMRVQFVNNAACRFLSLPKERIINARLDELFPEETFSHQKEKLEWVFKTGRPVAVVEPISYPLGLRWLETHLMPIRNSTSGVAMVLGISRDITEQRMNEDALAAAEAKFRSLVEQSIAGIYIIQDYKFSYVNPKLAEIFGYSQGEMIGMQVLDVVAPESKETVRENIRKRLEGEVESIHYELKGLRKDGSLIDCEVHGSRSAYNGKPAVIGVLVNITEKRKAELQRRISERFQDISRFAGEIGHEFNNLLTAITGNVSLAKMYTKPGYESYEILLDIEKAALHARSLSERLLAISHGEEIKKSFPAGRFLRQTVFSATDSMKLKCECKIPEKLPHIVGDEERLGQALHSLLSSLCRGVPEGSTIKVTASVVADKNASTDFVKISITGYQPIRQENLDKLFDPSYAARDLDMSAAYTAVQRNGGFMEIESQGSCFNVYLPALVEKSKKTEEPELALYGKGRVLVMDDDELVRTVLGRMLLQCGYDSDMAEEGAEALKLYEDAMNTGRPYDAVIIDLVVKRGMGGKEMFERLLKIDPQAVAIVSSGYSDDPILSDYKTFGFAAALEKPFETTDLARTLAKVIKKKR